ncbi:MAG: PAS domain S-box protein, partial [Longimicrobiales bacterium]
MQDGQERRDRASGSWLADYQHRPDRYRIPDTAKTHEILAAFEAAVEELRDARENLRIQSEELRNTTRRLEAERNLRAQLFDAAPDACVITDINGIVREANHAAATLAGVSPARLIGKPFAVLVADPDRAAFRAAFTRLARYEAVPERDVRIVARTGEVRTVTARASAMAVKPGDDTGIRWILRDVSDRVRADEAMRLLRYEQAARQASEGAERRALFLAEASRVLLEVQGVEATVARIIRLAVPGVGQYAALDVVESDGRLRRAAAAHTDPAFDDVLRRT